MNPLAPSPTDPDHERYSATPFPSYRFVPGRFPHPRRDPMGHSYGKPEPTVTSFSMSEWVMSESYLYGVDLFNFAFWWECHEQWEAIWKFTGPTSHEGRLLQGMVQISAACLRKFMGSHDSGRALARKGLSRLREFEDDVILGLDVAEFIRQTGLHFEGSAAPPLIELRFPACDVP